jgi:hypothetical protein
MGAENKIDILPYWTDCNTICFWSEIITDCSSKFIAIVVQFRRQHLLTFWLMSNDILLKNNTFTGGGQNILLISEKGWILAVFMFCYFLLHKLEYV